MHDIHLGIGRDSVASGLVYLVENGILKTEEGLSSKDLQGILHLGLPIFCLKHQRCLESHGAKVAA